MRAPGRFDRASAVGVALVVAAGIALRFVQRSDLWLDEALTVNIARLPLADITDALRHDGHPPLYYWLLHVWMRAFGDGDVAVRTLSGVFSVATLPLAWLAGHRRGGRPMAVATLVVVATSPYAIRYGSETRMYSLVTFLVFAGWVLLDDARRRPTIGRLVAVAITSGLLLLSHYWSIWLLGAVGIGLLVRAHRTPSERSSSLRSAVAVAAGGLLMLPIVPLLLHQAGSTGTPWAGPVRPTAALAVTLTDMAGPEIVDTRRLLAGGIAILLLLGLCGVAKDAHRIEIDLRTRSVVRPEAVVAALTLGIGLLASYASSSTYVSRYAAVFIPLLLLVAGAGLACFVGRTGRAVTIAAVAGLGLGGGIVTAVDEPRTEAGVVADAIAADGASAGDVIVYCPDQLGPAVDRLVSPTLVGLAYPTLGDPAFVDWEDYAERNAAADPAAVATEVVERAGAHRIYLVSFGEYKTFAGQCEALAVALDRARPGRVSLVAADGDYFEPSALMRYP